MPPVIALHGFTGAGADFAPVADGPWQTPDIVGHGTAAAPREVAAYAIEREVERLLPSITPETLLLGYSMGGRLALALAVALAEGGRGPAGLVLIGATPGLAEPAARLARQRADMALADRIEAIGVEAFLAEWVHKPIIASQRRIAPEIRAEMARRRRLNRSWGLANSLRGMGTGVMPSLWHRLGDIRCPTLLVTGADDAKFDRIAAHMAAALPDGERVRIEGAGHCAHLEAPGRFRAALNDWRARRGT